MSSASITYVGHATVLVELDGARLLTDPLLRRRVAHLRRVAPLPAEPLRPVDGVLLSHQHMDHLDLPSLRWLGRETPLVVPAGTGEGLRRHGFSRVLELGPGDAAELGGLTVRATSAVHDGRRLSVGAHVDALGYVVAGSRSVYFAGDTDLFEGMADLGPVDVALLPVAGWGPTLPAGHLDPVRAAEALRLLRPRIAVPIHWGTYAVPGLGGAARGIESARAFAAGAAERAPEVEVRILRPGEHTLF